MILALAMMVLGSVQGSISVDRSEVSAKYQLPPTSKGFSLIAAETEPTLKDAAEPNVPQGFGVGFDVENPKETNPFNANGNIYDRPQREVSLHWNGVEVANRLSSVEIRSTKPQEVKVKVENTLGGSFVTVWVEKTKVYDRYLVPSMRPIKAPWKLVGTEGQLKQSIGKSIKEEASTRVKVFDAEVNDAGRHRFSKEIQLPENVDKTGRVVGTLTLGPTAKGIDAWDRVASLSLTDEAGHRFEVVRCITPYRKAWTWQMDLTYLLPLLKGKKTFSWECETYGEGWNISFDLNYCEGRLSPRPVQVLPLWQGTYEIGTKKPLPATISYDVAKSKRAEVVTTVTGHGMSPNTNNAAEFFKLWRKLVVNGISFQNDLWKEDNYLNPCRPQGGTWKYDRAGWAPGSVVDPWRVDVTKQITPKTQFEYQIEPYINNSPVEGNPARHIIESVLVLWR